MKRFWIIMTVFGFFCLALFSGTVYAQEKPKAVNPAVQKWIDHYYNRVDVFKKENAELKNIILLGDSLTEGFDVKKYFPDRRVLNRGIVADHVGLGERGILKRLDSSIFDCNPSHVFLLIGVNDLGDDNSPEAIEKIAKGYREICSSILEKAPGVKLYLESCLPTGKKYARLNESIIELNKRIKKIAEDLNLTYIDLHSLLKDEKGELKEEFTPEGLHLKPGAYDLWRKALDPYLPPVMGTNRTGMTSVE
jgi:lysophospholipase L1-like esterase